MYLLALDQGTSSSRSIIFNDRGEIVGSAQQEFTQYYPQAGWVEHDAMEIWQSQISTLHQVLKSTQLRPQDIAAIGITNQRETTILWHRKTGLPICPAIVWQDRRTSDLCEELRSQGYDKIIRAKTGLVLDPYFSASKIAWILEHIPSARALAERGELAFGTVDTWLAYQLSDQNLHVTDVTNASRTMLWNIHEHCWDQDLLTLFNIPESLLPQVHPSSYRFGDARIFEASIPIAGIAGDQQAALFGQVCFEAGLAKNTYGTGCFMLLHTGEQSQQSEHGLINTRACQLGTPKPQPAQFALEGSVFIGGAVVQWLRDNLHAISKSNEIETLAAQVKDSDGVIFIPAFAGLGAPHWTPQIRGAIFGLHRGTQMAHIARAAIEAIAYQSTELLFAMQEDCAHHRQTPLREMRVDGGAAANNFLLQFQADLIGIPVVRPKILETTALGVAFLAGLAIGLFEDMAACAELWQEDRRFEPQISSSLAAELLQQWQSKIQVLRSTV